MNNLMSIYKNVNTDKKMELDIPPCEIDMIDKNPKQYVNIYNLHSMLERLHKCDKFFVQKDNIDLEQACNYTIFIYDCLFYKMGDAFVNANNANLDNYDMLNAEVMSEIHTEIVQNREKFITTINEFFSNNGDKRDLFIKLKEENYISAVPNEIIAICDCKANLGTKHINIEYPVINLKEINAFNGLVDEMDEYLKTNHKHGGNLKIYISWVNYYHEINNSAHHILGPSFIKLPD